MAFALTLVLTLALALALTLVLTLVLTLILTLALTLVLTLILILTLALALALLRRLLFLSQEGDNLLRQGFGFGRAVHGLDPLRDQRPIALLEIGSILSQKHLAGGRGNVGRILAEHRLPQAVDGVAHQHIRGRILFRGGLEVPPLHDRYHVGQGGSRAGELERHAALDVDVIEDID